MSNLRIEFHLYVQTLCPNEQYRILLYNNVVLCIQSIYELCIMYMQRNTRSLRVITTKKIN